MTVAFTPSTILQPLRCAPLDAAAFGAGVGAGEPDAVAGGLAASLAGGFAGAGARGTGDLALAGRLEGAGRVGDVGDVDSALAGP